MRKARTEPGGHFPRPPRGTGLYLSPTGEAARYRVEDTGPGHHPGSRSYWLCDPEQATLPPWASVSPSGRMGIGRPISELL